MDTWRSHFYALLNRHFKPNPNVETNIDNFLASNKNVFNSLNYKITQKEISESISDLKSKKAPGADGILNEMLKTAHPFITKQLELLFNAIFTSPVFPDIWRIQILNPLHKKGDIYQPENYRGITIGSCLRKLFLSILHGRLVKFADTNKLIPIHQIGLLPLVQTSSTWRLHAIKTWRTTNRTNTNRTRQRACTQDNTRQYEKHWDKQRSITK